MMDFSKNDLSKAQKGDQLWNYFAQLWETVEDIEFGDVFPIKFKGGSKCDFSGRETKDDIGPTYFWNEIHFDIPKRPKRKVERKIERWAAYNSADGELVFSNSEEQATRAVERWNDDTPQDRWQAVKTIITYEIEE
jgi:hypothetical protein